MESAVWQHPCQTAKLHNRQFYHCLAVRLLHRYAYTVKRPTVANSLLDRKQDISDNRVATSWVGQSGLDRLQGWDFLLRHRNHVTQPTSSSYLGSSHVHDAPTAWSSSLFSLYSRGTNTRHYTSEPPHISMEWFLTLKTPN